MRTRWVFLILLGMIGAGVSAARIRLAWDANTETDLAGYMVYQAPGISGGEFRRVLKTAETTAKLDRPTGIYRLYVTAINTSGLESDPSNVVTNMTQEASPPANLVLTVAWRRFSLAWDANSESERVRFYTVYEAVGTNAFVAILKTADRTVRLRRSAGTYRYRVTAWNDAGESAPSNEVVAETEP